MTDVVEVGRSDWVVIVAPGIAETIEVPSQTLDLVEVAEQGPAGPPGPDGNAVSAKPLRSEAVSAALIYQGYAPAGSGDSDPVFTIRRLSRSGASTTVTHAEGLNAWGDRASLVYL